MPSVMAYGDPHKQNKLKMCQADAITAVIMKKSWTLTGLREGGVRHGVKVRYVKAVRLYQGDHAMFAWHNKTLKPQLKGNIWRKGLYVSQSEMRRVRDTHRKR